MSLTGSLAKGKRSNENQPLKPKVKKSLAKMSTFL
jgi:hypothetical protein